MVQGMPALQNPVTRRENGQETTKVIKKTENRKTAEGNQPTATKKNCPRCGGKQHPFDQCPAKNKKCGWIGHLGKMCRNVRQAEVDGEDDHTRQGNAVTNASEASEESRKIEVQIHVEGSKQPVNINTVADTGVDISIMGTHLYREHSYGI